jgi:hypothetical protein
MRYCGSRRPTAEGSQSASLPACQPERERERDKVTTETAAKDTEAKDTETLRHRDESQRSKGETHLDFSTRKASRTNSPQFTPIRESENTTTSTLSAPNGTYASGSENEAETHKQRIRQGTPPNTSSVMIREAEREGQQRSKRLAQCLGESGVVLLRVSHILT